MEYKEKGIVEISVLLIAFVTVVSFPKTTEALAGTGRANGAFFLPLPRFEVII